MASNGERQEKVENPTGDKQKVSLEEGPAQQDKAERGVVNSESDAAEVEEKYDGVVYKLRDINHKMVDAWKIAFEDYIDREIEISLGDIFKGAPAADAIVSPANSFGFMDGGIDMAFSRHFGWQMQHRLQKVIMKEYDGENLVGNAIIIPAYDEKINDEELEKLKSTKCNEGKPIKYLISAPTMRIPLDVSETVNAYLAFRAVILAVQKHNKRTDVEPIKSVLCPGLGTAVGKMPKDRCALQMLEAFKRFDLNETREMPKDLYSMVIDHEDLSTS